MRSQNNFVDICTRPTDLGDNVGSVSCKIVGHNIFYSFIPLISGAAYFVREPGRIVASNETYESFFKHLLYI